MKKRIILFVTIFLFFIVVFVLAKIVFFWMHSSMGGDIYMSDMLKSLWHGLKLDLSMSGYLTILPSLVLVASPWIDRKIIQNIYNAYFGLILTLITIINVVDLVVYPYWGFHFDASVFLYLRKPQEALASASFLQIGLGLMAVIVVSFVLYAFYAYFIRRQIMHLHRAKDSWKEGFIRSAVLLLLTGALFLPIRGGVTVSTMNVGKVYYSDNMFLNHTAINPVFNLMYSALKSENFSKQYQFFDRAEAERIFAELNAHSSSDTIPRLLKTDRPNIIFFILESFSADVALDSIVAPNMSRFAKEGVLFDNFYANSFRTDRGLVSILSGYPAQPTVAIMKYPNKTLSLPAIPKSLKKEGYNLSFYYGGDADFANMRSYFIGTCGIGDIYADSEYPINQRLTKWGVPDKYLIERVYSDIEKNQQHPFMKTVLTLSSHEPFDVPVTKFGEPFLNAVSYTDGCLGSFVEKLKQTKEWDNTLIIFVADHCMQWYPSGIDNNDPRRFRIPMVWIGGAIKEPRVVSDYASQNDIAATLLAQLNIKYDDYKFSKDILDPMSNKFAFYSYVNGFSMIDSTGIITYDNDRKSVIRQEGNPALEKRAKAFFQNMYIDLGER